MKNYSTDKIRNIALLGHGGCGKSTLVEAMLFQTKAIKRMGSIDDKNTVSDFDKEEKERGFSIGTSVVPLEFDDYKLNILDTPGYFDFLGEVYGALRVAKGAILVVDATSGVEVGTEKAWDLAEEKDIPRIIFLNRMDKENVKFEKVLDELKEKLGKKVVPFSVPIGSEKEFNGYVDIISLKAMVFNGVECVEGEAPAEALAMAEELRAQLMESVAETNEEMMEKFFEGETFTEDEIRVGLKAAVMNGELVPVVVGTASKTVGVKELMHLATSYLPSEADLHEAIAIKDGKEVIVKIDKDSPVSAFVFKTIVDPFVGKISIYKVLSGTMKKDLDIYNVNKNEVERIGSVFFVRGKEQLEATEVRAGDIGASAKLQYAQTGDTLATKAHAVKYPAIEYPKPCLFMSVEPKSKDDEEKIGQALTKLTDEDPTFVVIRNTETKQLLIGGQGNMQLSVIINKMKNTFNVEVDLSDPKIAFRETIKGKSDVQGKHKKQSGGAGQYGDVHIRFEPSDQEFEFKEEIFGGSVPRQYIPAVEKGLRECLDKGVLAGFPVVNLKAVLYDGTYHNVDSSEMAFKVAASLAFKKGVKEAKPILLEPIMSVRIMIPDDYMGDIMGDMNKRRGRILGMEQLSNGKQLVMAEAPQAEMFKYAIDLKSMTQARGSFEMEFLRYDEMPSNLAEKVIADAKKDEEN
ncbi:MAG: Translation elongation factor G-related protein [Clostridiales bacterium 38_11]|nr:MAG: Translation elongation factor G-related protein [Clostridiales bacterium 38_11]HBH12526.1 elongation factor G [Clostridiales bacterium]